MRIPLQVAHFLAGHDIVMFAASAVGGRPACTLCGVPRVEDEGRVLSIALSSKVVPDLLDNLTENPWIAVSATRAPDCVSYQIKGRALSIGPLDPSDVWARDRYVDDLMVLLHSYNTLAREAQGRLRLAIDRRVRLEVTDVFSQTPGPGAGARMGP